MVNLISLGDVSMTGVYMLGMNGHENHVKYVNKTILSVD